VDDGSHLWDHQILTLQQLYPHVKPGGFFVLEDLHTSFGSYVPTYRGASKVSAFDYLQRLAKAVTAGPDLDLAEEPDPFIRAHAADVEFVALHRRTAVLRRRRSGPATLTAHIGNIGDVVSHGPLAAGTPGGDRAVQGFVLELADGAPEELQYRALLHDGTWTPWLDAGGFAGTRGRSLALRGFAIRLAGRLAERFACDYAGSFAAEPVAVHVGGGRDCRGGGGALEAMYVYLRPRAT
jgi:hypothetical protein